MTTTITMTNKKGLTLIEIIVSIAVIAIVAGIGITVYNPGGQLAAARNTQRQLHLQALMNAIRQNVADSSTGTFVCSSGTLPTTSTKMTSDNGGYNIAPCLVPTYILATPFDPSASGGRYVSNSDYDTAYNISYSASTTQITLSAPSAELGKVISLIR